MKSCEMWNKSEIILGSGIITYSIISSGILNLTVYFNASAYVVIIWLSFDKNLTVLSKSQTELLSVKYGNPPK